MKNLQNNIGLDFISFLKFRGGYGEIGNSEPAGDFAYNGTTSINSSAVIFGPDGTQTQISGSTVDYVPNPYLRWETIGMTNLALDAGFTFEASSEINANKKDTANHPKGVWTLPPSLSLGEKDREKYLAIGESDRMTLRFRKPVN